MYVNSISKLLKNLLEILKKGKNISVLITFGEIDLYVFK